MCCNPTLAVMCQVVLYISGTTGSRGAPYCAAIRRLQSCPKLAVMCQVVLYISGITGSRGAPYCAAIRR